MGSFYKIAGLTVEMDSFGRTVSQAIPYMVEPTEEAQIKLEINFDDMKKRFPSLSDDGCEYLSSGRYFYQGLLNYEGLMIHSSAVVMDGKAYLFTADCGTGKSTHTSIWRRVFGDEKVRILNDDKPALRLEDGIWYAYGTPWCGKTGLNSNLKAELAGIAVLERGEQNEIVPYAGKDAIFSVFQQTSNPKDPLLRMKLLEMLDKLMSQVPVWKLRCNMEPEAAIVAYEAMSGKKWR